MNKINIPLNLAKYSNFFISSIQKSFHIQMENTNLISSNSFIFIKKFNNLNILQQKKLFLQIDFSDINNEQIKETKLPQEGILQIFINPINPIDNLFFYSENIDNMYQENIIKNYNNISFIQKNEICPLNDLYHSKYYYSTIYQALTKKEKELILKNDKLNLSFYKLLGYSCFKQPFNLNEKFNEKNPLILLLQFKNNGQLIKNIKAVYFYIHLADLINKDFSKIITVTQ